MDYPAYPVYRESGIEWLGKIPDHWEVKALKFFSSLKARIGFHGLSSKDFINEGAYCITGTDFKNGSVDFKNCYYVSESWYEFDKNIQVRNHDLLVTKDGTIGKVALVDGLDNKATLNSGVFLLRPSINSRFTFWSLNSRVFGEQVDLISRGSTINHLYERDFNNFYFSIPSNEEQSQIAQFLDHKTQQIDQLIAKKQTLIDKLNEQRIALITHAVTKGLNPAVTLKDSGVEWLGEIPKHWEVVKLSYRYEVLLGKMLDDKRITGDFLGEYLRNTDVQWGRINDESLPQMDFRPDEYERYSIKKGDLVVCEGGEIGRCAIWERETPCFYQKALHRLRPVDPKNDNVRFMFYVLFDAVHQERFINGASKATIAHLPAETFRQYRFAYPPMIEQLEIVEYLDRETARIDRMVELNQQTIDKLKEYRTALITAAVTGKIDLRNWQQEANHANP